MTDQIRHICTNIVLFSTHNQHSYLLKILAIADVHYMVSSLKIKSGMFAY